MAPLNIGIIGTGIFATIAHLPAIKKLSSEYQVSAASNRTQSKAESFAKEAGANVKVFTNWEDLINDPSVDVIDALLPVQTNLDVVEKVLKSGKPLMFEKPIANNLENARKIVELTSKSDVPVLILENWLYHHAFGVVQSKIGSIGKVIGFNYESRGPFAPDNVFINTPWRLAPEHLGGYLSDGGVHQLAYLTGILGPVESVSAHTTQVRETSGADDVLFSTLKLKSGAIGTYTYGSAFGAVDKKRTFSIYGDKGSILFDFSPQLAKPKITISLGDSEVDSKVETIEVDEVDDTGIVEEFKNFYEAVSKKDKSLLKGKPEVTFHHLAVVDAALKSSKAGGDAIKVETL